MKKWIYWLIMCLVSFIHGWFFYLCITSEFEYAINQPRDDYRALIIMGGLPYLAAGVLIILHVVTLVYGIIERKYKTIRFINLFRMKELPKKAIAGRIVYITVSALLILLAAVLFVNRLLSVCYALSGGLLLYLLYIWFRIPNE